MAIDRDGILGSQEGNHLNFIPLIKFTMESHPPVCVSGNSFLHDTTKNSLSTVHICILCYLYLISKSKSFSIENILDKGFQVELTVILKSRNDKIGGGTRFYFN